MTELRADFSAQPNELPGDDAAREARHAVLATLLGAYADGELPPETVSQIDAHLIGCARCRREVAMQQAVHDRLSQQALAPASAALRERVMRIVATTPLTVPRPAAPSWVSRGTRVGAVAALVLAAAAVSWWRPWADRTPAVLSTEVAAGDVPLLASVLDDYRRVTAGDLPGRARDLDAVRSAVPFPVEPLAGSELRLLAAWSAELRGEPAAVLAYRWQDRLVLQYIVGEQAFFRHPGLRGPVASGLIVTSHSGAQALAAWPDAASGVVLIGDTDTGALAALRVRAARH